MEIMGVDRPWHMFFSPHRGTFAEVASVAPRRLGVWQPGGKTRSLKLTMAGPLGKVPLLSQGGPLLVINGVITPINGLITG